MASSSITFTNSALGDVPIAQLTGNPSKQSMIGDRYTFPAGMRNSVISVNHLLLGLSAWKSRLIIFSTSGLISPL